MANTKQGTQYARGAIVLSPDISLEHVLHAIEWNFSAQQAYFKFACIQAFEDNFKFIPVLEKLLANPTFLANFPYAQKEKYVERAYDEYCPKLIEIFRKHPVFSELCSAIETQKKGRTPTPDIEREKSATPESKQEIVPSTSLLRKTGSFKQQNIEKKSVSFGLPPI